MFQRGAALAVSSAGSTTLEHLRFRYALSAIFFAGSINQSPVNVLRDVQFLHCGQGVYQDNIGWDPVLSVKNSLVYDVSLPFTGYHWSGSAELLTVDGCGILLGDD